MCDKNACKGKHEAVQSVTITNFHPILICSAKFESLSWILGEEDRKVRYFYGENNIESSNPDVRSSLETFVTGGHGLLIPDVTARTASEGGRGGVAWVHGLCAYTCTYAYSSDIYGASDTRMETNAQHSRMFPR